MARSRIVLETSDQRKRAITSAAELQGSTVSDWFEEQLALAIPKINDVSPYPAFEAQSPADLLDTHVVIDSLQAQSWSFTDDDTQYLTHDLHPYPAKFIPQIPAHLISRLSVRGDLVLDPFGGSATTAVEAVRLRRRAVSIDANPLSVLIGQVKTGFMNAPIRAELDQLSAAIDGHAATITAQPEKSGELTGTHQEYVPGIPNIERWFSPLVISELALIRHLIDQTTEGGLARNAALLALSRIIIRVSNQDSETRYVSVEKSISPALCLKAYLESLRAIIKRLEAAAYELQYADAHFIDADSRFDLPQKLEENSIDLIVTSPPYPNATDYHLYHRFRLFWLGFDPRELGRIEIGSHLRHQRNATGFEEYRSDMAKVLEGCSYVLAPGRYAVFVVGDALFKGKQFSTSSAICEAARQTGLQVLHIANRPIHETRRSFAKPARRARLEQLVILGKPNKRVMVTLTPPAYKMWDYEKTLRRLEIEALTGTSLRQGSEPVKLSLNQPAIWNIRKLAFTREYSIGKKAAHSTPTWQKVLENGDAECGRRKDPKYVTHGLHPYKGKFYPQLAKSILNISGAPLGGNILDPYCGSGTSLLEGMLNGYATFGCDLHPLAAKIARAKTTILTLPRDFVNSSMRALVSRLNHSPRNFSSSLDQFTEETRDELAAWFPAPVLFKLNWILHQSRTLGHPALVDFLEVVASSIVREVSHQDPRDLRIRRRKESITDAPVIEMFRTRLEEQYRRLQKYWAVAGRQPGRLIPPRVAQGDSRATETFQALGLGDESVDCVVTSPPYATALPYIDTDRLSLLAILGLPAQARSEYEINLTGSREIHKAARYEAEHALISTTAADALPRGVLAAIRKIYRANTSCDVGFRRANMASLLWRYFCDVHLSLKQVTRVMKKGASAFYVVGDSRTMAGDAWVAIETCRHIVEIGRSIGLQHCGSLDIDVTTENYKHIKNAITKNQIIIFRRD